VLGGSLILLITANSSVFAKSNQRNINLVFEKKSQSKELPKISVISETSKNHWAG
jgi:hypothetical protein